MARKAQLARYARYQAEHRKVMYEHRNADLFGKDEVFHPLVPTTGLPTTL